MKTKALSLATRVTLRAIANRTSDLSQQIAALVNAENGRERHYWQMLVDSTKATISILEAKLAD